MANMDPKPRQTEFDTKLPSIAVSTVLLDNLAEASAQEGESKSAFVRRAIRASVAATERRRMGLLRDRECIRAANAAIMWIKAHMANYQIDSDELAESIDSMADIIEKLSPKGRES